MAGVMKQPLRRSPVYGSTCQALWREVLGHAMPDSSLTTYLGFSRASLHQCRMQLAK